MEVASQLYLAFDEKYFPTKELDAVLDNDEKLAAGRVGKGGCRRLPLLLR